MKILNASIPRRLILIIFFLLLTIILSSESIYASVPAAKWLWTVGTGICNVRGGDTDSSGNYYVAEYYGSSTSGIYKYDNNGGYISTLGTYGTANGQFRGAYDVAVDSNGNIFVADTTNHRIQKFDSNYVWQWTVGGTASGTADGMFNSPRGISVDGAGNVYVADSSNHRIQKFDTNGNFLDKFGSAKSALPGDFNYPSDVAIDSVGNIYVADTSNHRVQKFDSNKNFLLQYGVPGSSSTTILDRFSLPSGIDVDSNDNVYVSSQHRVHKITSSGLYLMPFGSIGATDGLFSSPYGVTVDSSGSVFVADTMNKRVQKFDYTNFAYQISNIGESYDVFTVSDAISVSAQGTLGVNNPAIPLRIKNSEGIAISDVTVDMTADRDWSLVDADSDVTYLKAYVKNLTTAPGASVTHTLYVPIPDGKVSVNVFICPQATSLAEVTTSCPNGVRRGVGTYSESFGEIDISQVNNLGDNVTYWKISGLTGTGALTEVAVFTGDGGGTVESPYEITTCSELQEIRYDLASTYELVNDIDCTDSINWNGGIGLLPIGTVTYPFTGTLNGNGFTISNLFVHKVYSSFVTRYYAGLFGYTQGAQIRNVKMTGFLVKGHEYMGGLIGFMSGGVVDNCHVAGTIEESDIYQDVDSAGGLIGHVVGGAQISDSSSNVFINIRSEDGIGHGGFVGRMDEASIIENSYSTGNLVIGFGGHEHGGFIGMVRGNSTINDSYATGSVTIRNSIDLNTYSYSSVIGGFSGGVNDGNINRSYSSGDIVIEGTDGYQMGGFVGVIYYDGIIADSYSLGDVSFGVDSSYGGGFIGEMTDSGGTSKISRCHSEGDILMEIDDNSYSFGGFAGGIGGDYPVIEDSYSTGDIVGLGGNLVEEWDGYVGGFVGETYYTGKISRSFSTGNISNLGMMIYVGGFAGQVNDSYFDEHFQFDKCASYGNVEGYDYVGGFAGIIFNPSITLEIPLISNSFSRGNVTAGKLNAHVGGFVGSAGTMGFIQNNYSTGTVTATATSTNLGAFLGVSTGLTVTNSYWDTETSGIGTATYGTGLSTAQMKTSSSFTDWDFLNIWNTTPTVNNGYPNLTFNTDELNGITPSTGTLTPAFDTGTATYTVTVPYSSSTISFKTSLEKVFGGHTTVNNRPTVSDNWGAVFNLVEGENNFIVNVPITTDTLVGTTYAVTVTRLASVPGDEDPPVNTEVSIEGLVEGLSAEDEDTRLDVSVPSEAFKGLGRKVGLYVEKGEEKIKVAETTVDLTESRNWSNVRADADKESKKSVVVELENAPGASDRFTLFVPKGLNDNRVKICLGPSSLAEVTALCPLGSTLTEENESVEVVVVENETYWSIDDVSGVGGVSIEVPEEDPPTPPADEEEETPYVPPTDNEDPEEEIPTDEEPIDEEEDDDTVIPGDDQTPNDDDENPEEGEEKGDSVFTKVVNSIKEVFKTTLETLSNANIDTPTTKVVAVGSFTTILISYLVNIFSAGKDTSLYTLQLISSLIAFGKLRKKTQNYGIVYDSVTKEPITQAVVRVSDLSGKLVTTVVTDIYGIFDINLESGAYKFTVEGSGYTFPSRTIQMSEDLPYQNVYLGGVFNHSSNQPLNISIPMDRIDSRFVEESGASVKNILKTVWNILVSILFVFGLITMIFALFNNPTTLAWIIFGIYILFLVIYTISKLRNSKKYGYVSNSQGVLLSGLEVGLMEQEFGKLFAKRVTDDEGKYRFIVPGGKYKLVVLNPQFEITDLNNDMFEVKDGLVLVVNEDIVVNRV